MEKIHVVDKGGALLMTLHPDTDPRVKQTVAPSASCGALIFCKSIGDAASLLRELNVRGVRAIKRRSLVQLAKPT